MRRELERVLATPDLSKNTYEMVSKSLAQLRIGGETESLELLRIGRAVE